MHNPLVSILIPNYNKAPYIRETLDSVLAQTYTNWECIIVDDHSTDESWEILEEYQTKDSRFKIFKRPNHLPKGGNACRNYAFELSKGEYVNWFDSDDIMHRYFLQKKLERFQNNKTLDFVICDLFAFTESIEKSYRYQNLDLSQTNINYALHALRGDFWIQTSLPLFNQSYLKDKELFNIDLFRGQETEFFIRILISDPKFEFAGSTHVFWRLHDNSVTSSYEKSTIEKKVYSHFLLLEKLLQSFNNHDKLNYETKAFFQKNIKYNLYLLDRVSITGFRLYYLSLKYHLYDSIVYFTKFFLNHFFLKKN